MPALVVSMIMREGLDCRRYNAQLLHEEVAAIFTGNNGAPPAPCDIVVYPRDQPLHIIYSLMYPLIFPGTWLGSKFKSC